LLTLRKWVIAAASFPVRGQWSLRDTKITRSDRLDRLLLILAIAYLLLCCVGLLAKQQFTPSAWCSTNRDQECSIYTIGLIMLDKINASPPAAFAVVMELSESVSPNWGWGVTLDSGDHAARGRQ
jgi:hypothetical protein